jgi:pimeloyl-ACP methyl ester carboxylesterase
VPEELQIRIFGEPTLPTLVYLPGLHGDWTMISSFCAALGDCLRFVEITYPRTLTWTIEDYASAIRQVLASHGVEHGWLLGESFGSQPAWAMLGQSLSRVNSFQVDGLILAAGFVRYPFPTGPLFLSAIGRLVPDFIYRLLMRIYILYSRIRHRRSDDSFSNMREFIARRTSLDRQAMRHRLRLIQGFDPRSVARNCHLPVHYLAGAFDPLVPWPHVRRWLRRNCPGYRGGKTFWLSDHTVLVSSPTSSAACVLRWMNANHTT